MNLRVDTHIFIWLLKNPEKISPAYTRILKAPHTVYLSSISIAELMIKSSIGKLDIDFDPVEMAQKSGLQLLDFSADDAAILKQLPFHHKDPFDRMLISQCLNRDFTMMTSDKQFVHYDCKLAS